VTPARRATLRSAAEFSKDINDIPILLATDAILLIV
jgi:hypothetical protein